MSIFTKVRIRKPKKSAFNLSHERKFSCNMGELVPVLMQEILPGDTFQVRLEQLVRFQALKSPMMHRVDVTTHFFFVPNRLIWNKWEEFITGGENGTASPVFPKINLGEDSVTHMPVGGLLDHLGVPVQNTNFGQSYTEINALPLRAYYLIYNEYYRDQNLTSPINIDLGSGTSEAYNVLQNNGKCLKRAWEKDYFTSALPWAQRGPQVTLAAFGEDAKVGYRDGFGEFTRVGVGRPISYPQTTDFNGNTTQQQGFVVSEDALVSNEVRQLSVDSQQNVTSINELRRAYRLQEWLEKNARGGARYVEQILSHFGVVSSDARLQRPEYLGGGKNPVMVSEVLQNSATNEVSPQGNMAGHGVSAGSTPFFKRYFEEHGYIVGIMSVTPKPAYMQGLPRIFSKFDKFDYFFPEFDHLGEQPILKKEIYLSDNPEDNEEVFGYTPRYSEYRYIPSTVHGDMRTNLKFWHMANDYEQQPNLNSAFVECSPTNRVFAVEDPEYHKLVIQTYCDIKAIRPMSKYATPI